MAWEYSEKTKQLFMDAVHGKPGTHLGEIEEPDGLGEHGSIACGDALRFTFKVRRDANDPRRDVIVDARYLTFGCTSAIAASEALCCMIEGRELTPIEALKIKNSDIVAFLDGLPDQKIHCSVMGAEALQAAVFNWAQKRGVDLSGLGIDINPDEQEEGRIVCKCFTATEPYLRRKIKELNLRTIPEITAAIKAGGACMSCHHSSGGLQDLLNEIWEGEPLSDSTTLVRNGNGIMELPLVGDFKPAVKTEQAGASQSSPKQGDEALSPYQLAKKIERQLNDYIRPMIQKDGGDIELIDIKDMTVYVELRGTCAGCAGATQTLKSLVERTFKEQIDERIRVIQV
ncbi:MAG: iron-sulfur cluster assembly scaffold protein [Planctomycetaceae bacterium]|jgi:NifU-like protein|nr:iron-sulfur cluster assembly scaffold protein [Planctomycetaceae bacterium]